MPSDTNIALIVAAAENGVIGQNGQIPWRLSSDLKHFKALTLGHTVVIGRRTHESIGRPLPGRRTIVVTRAPLEGVETAQSLAEAVERAGRPVFLAGGEGIYTEGMALADTIHLTRVHAAPEGDTRFPDIDEAAFALAEERPGVRGPNDDHNFTYMTFRRLKACR
ncbi:dihydrofolate reductase [Acuticoccus sp. MNP-M23]|uniref:dihydrofolate reductase n=1 Tax=Acuticoccus sp. MNP-M23 TaxID=3072793 RepID=UPI0028163EA1|nr:dihydrofolate reductase [Acuticoccus sp. MNP-M23]WMS43308.1 dihydrofolate reductase [Acuticoccus sp. MNP-M23]